MLFTLIDIVFHAFSERYEGLPNYDHKPKIWLNLPQLPANKLHLDLDRLYDQHHKKRYHKKHNLGGNNDNHSQGLYPFPNTTNLDCTELESSLQNKTRQTFFCVQNDDKTFLAAMNMPNMIVYWLTTKTALALFLCIPFLALLSRRLKDCGHSSWWMLLLGTPFTGLLLSIYLGFKSSMQSKW